MWCDNTVCCKYRQISSQVNEVYKTQIASYIPHFTFTPVSIDAEKTTQNINTFGIKGPVAP